ncbi:hypothetical protein NF867_18075 [Solitalea sp. MAHUQ-68]|uniref:Uncharacterized protein n=1 Tax=Solitalea agri TaxID=2953739 RepID=A0A9X2JGU5_9SPHI|nr:hypothetical protein [Solitalea agri]MCO4294776.1 hypothetical protein [Solitalea agri]
MKKLILLFVTCAFALGAYAQEVPTMAAKTSSHKHTASVVKFWCPKCDYSSTERGDCPTDHVALIKEGDYYCKDHNNEISAQPGKCPQCHKKLSKMTAKTAGS